MKRITKPKDFRDKLEDYSPRLREDIFLDLCYSYVNSNFYFDNIYSDNPVKSNYAGIHTKTGKPFTVMMDSIGAVKISGTEEEHFRVTPLETVGDLYEMYEVILENYKKFWENIREKREITT